MKNQIRRMAPLDPVEFPGTRDVLNPKGKADDSEDGGLRAPQLAPECPRVQTERSLGPTVQLSQSGESKNMRVTTVSQN